MKRQIQEKQLAFEQKMKEQEIALAQDRDRMNEELQA